MLALQSSTESFEMLNEIPGVVFRIFVSNFTFAGRANISIVSRSSFAISPLLPFPHKTVGVGDIWLHHIQDIRDLRRGHRDFSRHGMQVFILQRHHDRGFAWSNVGPRLFNKLPIRYPSIFVRYRELNWLNQAEEAGPCVGWARVKNFYGEKSKLM